MACRLLKPQLASAYVNSSDSTLYLDLRWPDEAVVLAGAPRKTVLILRPQALSGAVDLHYSVLTLNKTATRLPEAMFASIARCNSWQLSKLDTTFDAGRDVQAGGARHNHVLNSNQSATCSAGKGDNTPSLTLHASSSRLVNVQCDNAPPSPFPTPMAGPDDCASTTVHLHLWNQIWNTNYQMWIDGDLQHGGLLTLQ